MPLTAGIRVGPYEVSELIGKGGMGEVFRAVDTRLARPVAIKVLPPTFMADAERLRRFEQEARAVGHLNHPNIVVVYDIGTHEGAPYIIQEFLDGETLAARLESGPLPPAKVIQYGVGIASGLSAAHAKGIVHRDLKPANVFLTQDGQVKILDFGLAKLTTPVEVGGDSLTTRTAALSPPTQPGLILGTVGYMSPEQVRGQAADARSDIFALGAVLYEMVSRRRAFTGSTAPEVLNAILNTDPPDLSQPDRPVPAGLEAVIRHCLEKNPAERFQSAQDLGFQLASIGTLSGATPTGTPGRARRRRVGAVVAALLLVGLGAALGFLGRRPPSVAPAPPPTFRPLTFQHGWVNDARFGPDGHTVLLSASWSDPDTEHLYQGDTERAGWIPLALPPYSRIAVSRKGELLLNLIEGGTKGVLPKDAVTLARAPMAGAAPRTLRKGIKDTVRAADWSPDSESIAAITMLWKPTKGGGSSGRPGRLEWPLGKVIAEMDEGRFIGAEGTSLIRISHDGQHAAVIEDGSRLALFSQSGTRTEVAKDVHASGLAWASDDRTLWVSGRWRDEPPGIYAISMAGSVRPVLRIPGELRLLDMAPNGRALVSREDKRVELRALPPGSAREVSLSWSDSACPEDLSADGRQVLFSDYGPGGYIYSSWIAPMDGSLPIKLGDGLVGSLSPDGQSLLALSDDGGVMVIPTGGGRERRVTSPGQKFEGPVGWLGNERVVVHAGDGSLTLLVVTLRDGAAKELSPEPCLPQPVGSPDGKWVACAQGALPVDGGAPRRIGPIPHPLAWDADARHVYKRGSPNGEWPLGIDRVEVGTERASHWKTIARPAATAGPGRQIVVARDG
ncbi:MAG: protein kinase, partial [Candidatus Eisenbacteria bacterium]|nr:protein kinase [Candidatus Eisenbacteria bacterium]